MGPPAHPQHPRTALQPPQEELGQMAFDAQIAELPATGRREIMQEMRSPVECDVLALSKAALSNKGYRYPILIWPDSTVYLVDAKFLDS
eukprot:scaffold231983_cov37-Prasinocladus_malaysianus.AAC.1